MHLWARLSPWASDLDSEFFVPAYGSQSVQEERASGLHVGCGHLFCKDTQTI